MELNLFMNQCMCDALRDFVPFIQFKKLELKPATLLKVLTILHGYFSCF